MNSDSWNSEPECPVFSNGRRRFSCTRQESIAKPLAASRNETSSSTSCEDASSVAKRAPPDVVARTRARKRASHQNGIDTMRSKRDGSVLESEGRKFRVLASSRCKSPSLHTSDVIGTIDFNGDGNFFATGGIARKIRICSYERMVGVDAGNRESSDEDGESSNEDDDYRMSSCGRHRAPHVRDHDYASAGEICTPGKLSSLKWRPDGSEVIGCGDYDGVVMEWNIEHSHTVSEKYEHSGQRVWSLDYSKVTPTISASSSEDGTVRVWSRGIDKSVSVLRPDSGNSVCSVEFSPTEDHLIAVASADANVYVYDLRNSGAPLLKLGGHGRAVSYVRFLGKDKLVSASIDSTLKLWDISAPLRDSVEADDGRLVVRPALDHAVTHPVRTFGAHTNVRHFVGLSVHRGASILACGSETNEVFLYRDSSPLPFLNHKVRGKCAGHCGAVGYGSGNAYVGAVCWREHGDKYVFVAANSLGTVQVLEVIM